MADHRLKSRRFREAREWDWRRLEGLLRRIEDGKLSSLSDEDLLAVPVLYRSALSSLSVARATSLDKALVAYLESLCGRAYFFVYGPRAALPERLSRFFARDLPRAAVSLWRETLASLALMAIGTFVAFVLVSNDPDWYYAFVDRGLAGGRDPSATTEFLRQTLYGAPDERVGLSTMAMSLFAHNSGVAMFAFALGFAFCLPSAVLILSNGLMLGAFLALFFSRGLGFELVGWLMIHGATELFAVVLAGAAGLRIGWRLAFPGDETRQNALSRAGREAGTLMGGVVVMLLIAGLLEGFARQLITSDVTRYAIAALTGIVWVAYYYLPRQERAHGQG